MNRSYEVKEVASILHFDIEWYTKDGENTTHERLSLIKSAVAAITRTKPALAVQWQVTGIVGINLDSKKGNKEELIIDLEGQLDINDQWNRNQLKWDVEIDRFQTIIKMWTGFCSRG